MTTPLTLVLSHHVLTKYEMAAIPHPPYSPGLAPCDFFLLPKMKLKLEGCRFDTIGDTGRIAECLTLIEKEFQEAFQKWRWWAGSGVYMREGTTSTAMGTDRPYGEFYDFYSFSP
jgi:hypothetical protein